MAFELQSCRSMSQRPPPEPHAAWQVIVVDGDAATGALMKAALAGRYRVGVATSGAQALRDLRERVVPLVIVGTPADMTRVDLVNALRRPPYRDRTRVLIHDSLAQPSADVDGTGIYFRVTNAMVAGDLVALVERALTSLPAADLLTARDRSDIARDAVELGTKLAQQTTVETMTDVIVETATAVLQASRVICWLYDEEGGQLWDHRSGREVKATRGVVSYVARTGGQQLVASAKTDQRYHAAIDDPRGGGDERLLVQAVAAPDGEVHAVLVVVRDPELPAYTPADCQRVRAIADQCGAGFHRIALGALARSVARDDGEVDARGGLFRQQAIDAADANEAIGQIIRISPPWLSTLYRALLGCAVLTVLYMAIGKIDQYSEGVAVVRQGGRTEVAASASGAVTDVLVEAGANVRAGDLLVRLSAIDEANALAAVQRNFDTQLRERLLRPGDDTSNASLSALRRDLDAARARLAQREIRAASEGVVTDVAVRTGQHVEPGNVMMAIASEHASLSVVAFLPGGDLPQLHQGMGLRLELTNYRYAYQDLMIDSVSDGVIGPTEARRYLGPQLGDALQISGPVVLVRAHLPATSFEADGKHYDFHDGLSGTALVRIRRDSIIASIWPGFKEL